MLWFCRRIENSRRNLFHKPSVIEFTTNRLRKFRCPFLPPPQDKHSKAECRKFESTCQLARSRHAVRVSLPAFTRGVRQSATRQFRDRPTNIFGCRSRRSAQCKPRPQSSETSIHETLLCPCSSPRSLPCRSLPPAAMIKPARRVRTQPLLHSRKQTPLARRFGSASTDTWRQS